MISCRREAQLRSMLQGEAALRTSRNLLLSEVLLPRLLFLSSFPSPLPDQNYALRLYTELKTKVAGLDIVQDRRETFPILLTHYS